MYSRIAWGIVYFIFVVRKKSVISDKITTSSCNRFFNRFLMKQRCQNKNYRENKDLLPYTDWNFRELKSGT